MHNVGFTSDYQQGDIVLISLRGFDQATADIIHKYTADEARKLISYGELPASAKVNQTAIDLAFEGVNDEDVGFDFDEVNMTLLQHYEYVSI